MINLRRYIASSFLLVIPVGSQDTDAIVREYFDRAKRIENATFAFLDGHIDEDEFLDLIRDDVEDIDSYINEIELNLLEVGEKCPQLLIT